MTAPSADRDPVEKLAEEFAERYRRGERPPLAEYTQKYPELASEIRALFPALVMMEAFGSVSGQATGPFRPTGEERTTPPQLGEFRILREVGHGGMGVVYEAVQESLGRHVALKILPFHKLINPTHLERFRREARAAARLHHTNIVPVFGVGEHEGVHYFAMQFIQGQGLDLVLKELKRLRGQKASGLTEGAGGSADVTASLVQGLLTGRFAPPLPAGEEPAPLDQPAQGLPEPMAVLPACSSHVSGTTALGTSSRSGLAAQTEWHYFRGVARLGVQVAEALEYAHRQGILHRDIKPSNLLLDPQGTVWVTDFGLAKTEGTDELTSPGDIVGTLRYMAPERFRGQSEPRSDVYSLGLTLYELLTLRPAFAESDRAQMIERVLHEKPAPPRKLDRHIPRDLETVVLKAMAKEPSDRYVSAEALAEDLRRFLADRPIHARRASVAERSWRWCRRNPVIATLGASVLVLLGGLALGWWVASLLHDERDIALGNLDRARRAEDQWHQEQRRALGLLDQVQQAEQAKTRQLRDSFVDQARAIRLSPVGGRRFDSLATLDKALAVGRSLPRDDRHILQLRSEMLASLALTDLRLGIPWDCPADTAMLAWSRDFQRYVRSDGKGNLSIRRVDGDREVTRLDGPGKPAWTLLFSPNDRLLAARYEDGSTRVWDWEHKKVRISTPALNGYGLLDFSADSKLVALGDEGGSISVFEVATGKRRRLAGGGRLHSLAFHPRGRELAASYLTPTQAVRVYNLNTGQFRTVPHPNMVRGLAWDASGKLLATACGDNKVYVWDMAAGLRIATLEGHLAAPIQVAFDRRGDLLASAGWDGMVHLWNPLTGKQLASRPGAYGTGFPRLQFSPDCRQLAFSRQGNKVGLWTVTPGQVCRTLRPYQGPGSDFCYDAAISPDGRLLATAGGEGVYLCDLATNRTVAFLPGGKSLQVLFSASGKDLLVGGEFGLYRWPIARAAGPEELKLTFGPPQRLAAAAEVQAAGVRRGRDPDTLAVADSGHHRALVFPLKGKPPVVLGGLENINNIAVSPDGRWVAAGPWQGQQVKVWDARRAQLVKQLPMGSAVVAFSPDGKWLVTGVGAEYRFWEVGTWRPRHRVAREEAGNLLGPMAFSSDGKIVALLATPRTIRLTVPGTGQELATLTAPEERVIQAMSFSPDGTQLAAACWGHVIQVWDLRLARAELARLGLDWDLPALPAASKQTPPPALLAQVKPGALAPAEPGPPAPPTSLARQLQQYTQAIARNSKDATAYHQRGVVYATLGLYPEAIRDFTAALKWQPNIALHYEARGLNHLYLRHYQKAVADLRKAAALDPKRAPVFNYLARLFVTGPTELRDADKALPLVQEALRLAPNTMAYLNTLGIVYYRLGKYPEAIATLKANVQASQDKPLTMDLFFLAMSYQRRGEAAQAKQCYDQALRRWAEQNGITPSAIPALNAFRTEAESVLAKPAPEGTGSGTRP
jgi:serine/threonine protein kinase/WD40 repeat protein/lipoprotein NlpI